MTALPAFIHAAMDIDVQRALAACYPEATRLAHTFDLPFDEAKAIWVEFRGEQEATRFIVLCRQHAVDPGHALLLVREMRAREQPRC